MHQLASKHDFLHHFWMPHCNLLVWILITKLMPSYYVKLDCLLAQNGWYHELCSWQWDFRKEWCALEKQQVTLPVNDAYRPNAEKWICTCPAFPTSCFFICRHLVQEVEHVSPIFFLEVRHHRTIPFWQHQTLKVIQEQNHIDEGGAEATDNKRWWEHGWCEWRSVTTLNYYLIVACTCAWYWASYQ